MYIIFEGSNFLITTTATKLIKKDMYFMYYSYSSPFHK